MGLPMGLESIRTVSVIGAGLMGHGIAQVFAMNGYSVNLVDVSREILDRAIERIRWSLGKLAEKGVIREDIETILRRIRTFVGIREAVREADFIVEAVPERIDIKVQVFREADENAPKHAIIVSNTSGLPITPMAEATKRREKVAGMHWFNPPQLLRLIEVIRCKYTSDETAKTVFELSKRLGKEPIMVNRDIRRFIAARIYGPIRIEAFLMFLRGEAKPIEIDSAFRYKLGIPMGPFELVDFTGGIEIDASEDIYYNEVRSKYPEWEPQEEYVKYREAVMPFIRDRYSKGLVGFKTGRGFYDYPKPGQWVKPEIPREAGEGVDPMEVIAPAVNEAAWLVENNITSAREIDIALKLGYSFPKGILEMADEYGLDNVVAMLRAKRRRVAEDYGAFYEPQPLLLRLVDSGKLGRKSGEGFYRY